MNLAGQSDPEKRYYPQMDGLRALAALSVVMIHVSANFSSEVSYNWNQLTRFSVPMFMMLSGFGHGGRDMCGTPWFPVFRKRLIKILPPYFLWSAVYIWLDTLCGKPHENPVKDVLTGSAYMHLYYLFILLQILLLSAPLCRAVEKRPVATLILSAAVSLISQYVICWQLRGLLVLPNLAVTPVRLFPAWLVFYVSGIFLRRHPIPKRLYLIVIAAALFGISANALLKNGKLYPMLASSSLRPIGTLYTLAAWLLFWTLFSYIKVFWPVRFISRLSFGLYLAHPIVLRLWVEWASKQNPVIYLKIGQMYALVFAGGLIISLILGILPFGTFFGGAGLMQWKRLLPKHTKITANHEKIKSKQPGLYVGKHKR